MDAKTGYATCCRHSNGNTTIGNLPTPERSKDSNSTGRLTCRMPWKRPSAADVGRNISVPASMPICLAMPKLSAILQHSAVTQPKPSAIMPKPIHYKRLHTPCCGTPTNSFLKPTASILRHVFGRLSASCLGTHTWRKMTIAMVWHGCRLLTPRDSLLPMD